MDRTEKQKIREYIAQYLDVAKTRLSDDDAILLRDFLDNYAEKYRGRSFTGRRSHDGWSSDGKFTRASEWVQTFTDEVGLRVVFSYRDDDGQSGSSTTVIKDARAMVNWLKENRRKLG
jgi:hypothetical protein